MSYPETGLWRYFMASTIFGMSSFTYLVIGVIYAFANLDRHYAMQNENSEKDDKFFLWILLCIFWLFFLIADIGDNKQYEE